MIVLCSGQISQRHFEGLLLFAQFLDRAGYAVAIDDRFLAGELFKQHKFEAAPFLAEFGDIEPQAVVVVGAEEMSPPVQMILGAMRLGPQVPVWALGHFADLQAQIDARNRIAYATGLEPGLVDLGGIATSGFGEGSMAPLLTVLAEQPDQAETGLARVLVYLPAEEIEAGAAALAALAVLNQTPGVALHVLSNARGKDLIRESRHAGLSVFSYAELPPADLLGFFDILVFFGTGVPGERMAALALLAMGAGKVVIDATSSLGFAAAGAPVVKGPQDPEALGAHLLDRVLPHRLEIGTRIQRSDWLRPFDGSALASRLQLPPPAPRAGEGSGRTVFFPTNGNGIGHAQRCALIAEEMDAAPPPLFAAFPSCTVMLAGRGFDCVPMVPRSAGHAEEYAADLLNHLRLGQIVQAGDRIVFDGGYVFDSVYRLIARLQCPAVWIRRGLWQKAHVNPIALERERAFGTVIVPEEAFAELNRDYSFSDTVHRVGPVVRRARLSAAERLDLRSRLGAALGRPADRIVVTMLGGGVASERSAQAQLVCSLMERRADCLHLVVAWPGAVVASGLYGWQNSRVVHTARATELCEAADLVISASGYNSFHELLYAQVPAILIPQQASWLDDQERRARAAHDRGLARLVGESELLKLDREIGACLDGPRAEELRAALAATSLPETGNAAAARLIEGTGRA